jgi:D-amino peptidase
MSAAIREVRLNGSPVDEAGINGRVAGCFGVPVGLVSGDDRVCRAAAATFPGVEVAAVKRAIDRLSAESRTVEAARSLIRERAAEAVEKAGSGSLDALTAESPARFEVEFRSTSAAPASSAAAPARSRSSTPTYSTPTAISGASGLLRSRLKTASSAPD